MKSTTFLIAVSLLLLLFSCKGKKTDSITEITETTVVSEPVKEVPETPRVETKEPEENFTHFLIAGCFRIKDNADRLQAKLQGEGYSSRILPYYGRFYLVTYAGYNSKAEAQAALNKMVREQDKRLTWIYPVR